MSAAAGKTKPRLLTWLVASAAALGLLLLVLSVTVDDGKGGGPDVTAGDAWQRLAPPPASPASSFASGSGSASASASGEIVLATAAGRLLAVTGSEVRTFEDGGVGDGAGRWSQPVPIPGPARSGATIVGTPEALIVWGGRAGAGLRHDGYAYVPGETAWQALPTSPLSARQGARGVWTGREVVILGGGVDSTHTQVETAAYDPAHRTWRRLGDAEGLDGAAVMATAWTGDQVVVWGYHEDTADDDMLAVDPDADLPVWSTVASPPFPPTAGGSGLAGDPVGLVATATSIRPARAAVLPWRAPLGTVSRWRPLSSPPVPPDVLCSSELQHAGAGTVLLSECSDALFLLDPDGSPTWRRLPPPEPGAPDAGPGQALVTDDAVYYLVPGTSGTAPSLLRLELP